MEDVTLRGLQEDELLVEIIASGVCHTDVLVGSLKEGPLVVYPSVKGHEGQSTCYLSFCKEQVLIIYIRRLGLRQSCRVSSDSCS